jgi:hypothetical protein
MGIPQAQSLSNRESARDAGELSNREYTAGDGHG